MNERKKYATSNKKSIMKYIEHNKNDFSAKDLYILMKENKENIGLTTIYRFLEELNSKEIVKKFYDEKNIACYHYLERCEKGNHFYLKCNKCGILIHIDCNCITDLQNHILYEHKFKSDNKNIIINGLCEKCKGGN